MLGNVSNSLPLPVKELIGLLENVRLPEGPVHKHNQRVPLKLRRLTNLKFLTRQLCKTRYTGHILFLDIGDKLPSAHWGPLQLVRELNTAG